MNLLLLAAGALALAAGLTHGLAGETVVVRRLTW